MNSFDWEVQVLRHECVVNVQADNADEARKKVEAFLSIFTKVNLWGDVKLDTSYIEALLNGSPIPEKHQGLNVTLKPSDLKEILKNAKEIEDSANAEKREQISKKKLFRKVKKGTAVKDVSVNGAKFLFFPVVMSYRVVIDLFKTIYDSIIYVKNSLDKPKADEKKIKSKLDVVSVKGFGFRYYILMLAIFCLNVFLYININIILYVPVLIVSALYLLLVVYIYLLEEK